MENKTRDAWAPEGIESVSQYNERMDKQRQQWHDSAMRSLEILEENLKENPKDNKLVYMFSVLSNMCFLFSASKGFHDDYVPFPEFVALTHSELSEALEAYRHNNPPSEHIPGFSGIEEELADVLYRIFNRRIKWESNMKPIHSTLWLSPSGKLFKVDYSLQLTVTYPSNPDHLVRFVVSLNNVTFSPVPEIISTDRISEVAQEKSTTQ